MRFAIRANLKFFYSTQNSDGYLATTGELIHSASYHCIFTGKIPCQPGYIFQYKGSGKWNAVSWLMYNNDTIIDTAVFDTPSAYKTVEIPNNCNYIVFSSFNSSGAEVVFDIKRLKPTNVDDDIETIKDLAKEIPELVEIGKVTSKGFDRETDYPIVDIPYKLLNTDGSVSDFKSNDWGVSDFIDISKATAIKVSASTGYTHLLYGFYDSNKTFISGRTSTSGVERIKDVDVQIPKDAMYMRISRVNDFLNYKVHYNFTEFANSEKYKWYGKKWACVGDSLTEVNSRTSLHYHDYIAEKTGIDVQNLGVSGTGYARTKENNTAFYQRISGVDSNVDVVTIFGSFNDMGSTLPIGTVNDRGTSTIAGCINTTIDNLYAKLPTVALGIVSPTPWGSYPPATEGKAFEYVEMLKAICEKRSIPFLDLCLTCLRINLCNVEITMTEILADLVNRHTFFQ